MVWSLRLSGRITLKTAIKGIVFCSNQSDTAWFLCEEDYNDKSNSAFRWNEFELQSIEAADEDQKLMKEITDFWNRCLPIMLSVKSGYSFLGIIVSEIDYGKIVYGFEPEYEGAEIVLNSFQDLIALICDVLNGKAEETFLTNFL